MIVRCILVDTTLPVRIRPRIETIPVKGHFLSFVELASHPTQFAEEELDRRRSEIGTV